ncbi:MAG: bifunctional folylpolyglutamate synthase/dihydrofolate synthase [Deltaproteobacteria bacterium]|nr:MAG: bifunctional folylpolyglutamate synthase/dihydrofolate synthase [Deltaproteobacteria bacterium]
MNYLDFVKNLADREYFGQKLGLERVQLFLQHLGNPHQSYPSIHIAGTNGKGSTAAMLASVLKEAGYRVGLYTSPHLEDFCERIQISGEMISQNSLMQLVEKFQVIEKKIGIELTFFEFTTALAFQYFADQKIDIAVIEVGLGGRLDATNVMTPLVSVITSIGLDHQKFLGDTLEKIAFEKAGIIKPGVPVVIGEIPREGEQVIRRVAEEKKSWVVHGHGEQSRTMNVAQFDGSTSSPCPSSEMNKSHAKLGLIGEHQKINASMVLDVVRLLNQSGKFKICFPDIEKGLASVNWPGRLETISKKPWILLDGAHNVEAMQKVVDYVSVEKKGRKLFCLFGMMKDKRVKMF